MLKTLIGRFVAKSDEDIAEEIAAAEKSKRDSADKDAPTSAIAAAPTSAKLDLIVVPTSAMEAAEEKPEILVDAVINYVNGLIGQGRFNRDEMPHEAIEAYHCDYYLAQVLNGGHAQFVANSGANLRLAIKDTISALTAMGATDYLTVAQGLHDWIEANPDRAARQGFDAELAEELADLDGPFFELNRDTPLRHLLSTWIADCEVLQSVEDALLPRVMQGIANLNPKRAARDTALRIKALQHNLAEPLRLGLGMAGAQMSPLEPLLKVGAGSQMDIDGDSRLAFLVYTVRGRRWGVLNEEGASLFDYVDGSDPADHKPIRAVTADDFRSVTPPSVGGLVSKISLDQIEVAANVCREVHAGAAIDLLLSSLDEMPKVDFVSVRSAGPDANGVIGATLMIACDKAQRAFTVVVDETGARLLAEPEHEVIAKVSNDQIRDHLVANTLDEAA